MPVERIPGEKMYIDWVGDQPELLTDPSTGEIRKVHVFTTTLGFSSCVYAEIFLDEKLPSFINGVVHALEYYQAVPKYLVPDNLKTAVTKHSKDELTLNSVFSDLEDFYDVIVVPPPPRKPKGKPSVENHVRFLETHLIERLKKDIYTSLEELNRATQKIIATRMNSARNLTSVKQGCTRLKPMTNRECVLCREAAMRFVITGIMHVYRIIIILSMMVTIILYCIHTMANLQS